MALSRSPAGTREKTITRRLQAFDLRAGGASYRAIGRALGVSEAQAHRDVVGRLARLAVLEEGEAVTLRTMEVARLDALLLGHWARATSGGDPNSARIVLGILERRAKLLGLDAPEKRELLGENGQPTINVYLVKWEPPAGAPAIEVEATVVASGDKA